MESFGGPVNGGLLRDAIHGQVRALAACRGLDLVYPVRIAVVDENIVAIRLRAQKVVLRGTGRADEANALPGHGRREVDKLSSVEAEGGRRAVEKDVQGILAWGAAEVTERTWQAESREETLGGRQSAHADR